MKVNTTPLSYSLSLSHIHTFFKRMWHRKTDPFIQYTLVLLLPKQPWCIFILNSQLLTELQLLPQSRQVPQCRLHCRRPQGLEHRGWGKWQMLCCIVHVCVFVWTPTVSGIWRIGTVIRAALRISHKQMKAQSLKVRLISLSELHREYSEYGEGFLVPRGFKGCLLFSFPHLHANNNRKKCSKSVHQYSLIHRASWQLICRQAQHNGWAWNLLCRSVESVWNWIWN